MENIRRNIRIFFATYGGLLFKIIFNILIFFFVLRGLDYLYKENNENILNSNINGVIVKQEELDLEIENNNILFISKFLDYCNDKKIEEAYNMLSKECIEKKFYTVNVFKKEYIDEIFTYKKEYKIEKENNLYKIIILEGILESGSIENRNSIISYYRIDESVLERYIFIER